jgi:hypothetical protein
MPEIECVYGLHFSEIAQKLRETFEFKGRSLGELIHFLDEKYRGFQEELIDPGTQGLLTRNQILVARRDESTRPLFSPDAEIMEGDSLTFY